MMRIRTAAAASVIAVLAAGCNNAAPPAAPAAAPAAAAEPAAAAPAAAEAAVLKVSKSVTIAAPVATVWAKVKDFDKLNGWHPAVAKDEIVEGKNNEAGAVRLLTLGDGGTVKEKLTAFDDAAHSFGYTIVEGVLPVSAYNSTLVVTAEGEGSTVTWSGEFKHAEGKDDKTATDTITAVYTAGLDNLKKVLETK